MAELHVKIITPRKIVVEEEAHSVTVPGADGELTILPRHDKLLSLLKEGIITLRNGEKEQNLAIGAGYVETNGKSVNILVSQAYEQSEINEELTQQAIERAKKILMETKDKKEIYEAQTVLRRLTVDLKLLKKHRRPPAV